MGSEGARYPSWFILIGARAIHATTSTHSSCFYKHVKSGRNHRFFFCFSCIFSLVWRCWWLATIQTMTISRTSCCRTVNSRLSIWRANRARRRAQQDRRIFTDRSTTLEIQLSLMRQTALPMGIASTARDDSTLTKIIWKSWNMLINYMSATSLKLHREWIIISLYIFCI